MSHGILQGKKQAGTKMAKSSRLGTKLWAEIGFRRHFGKILSVNLVVVGTITHISEVNESLYHNPFMRDPILNAGYINNGDPKKMIAECVEWLKSGGTMIIFPEGTRSVPGKPCRFQRGAATIALQANQIVTPVTLSCYPDTLTKAEPWNQILPGIIITPMSLSPCLTGMGRTVQGNALTQPTIEITHENLHHHSCL